MNGNMNDRLSILVAKFLVALPMDILILVLRVVGIGSLIACLRIIQARDWLINNSEGVEHE